MRLSIRFFRSVGCKTKRKTQCLRIKLCGYYKKSSGESRFYASEIFTGVTEEYHKEYHQYKGISKVQKLEATTRFDTCVQPSPDGGIVVFSNRNNGGR